MYEKDGKNVRRRQIETLLSIHAECFNLQENVLSVCKKSLHEATLLCKFQSHLLILYSEKHIQFRIVSSSQANRFFYFFE